MEHPESEAMKYWHNNNVLRDGAGSLGMEEMVGVLSQEGGIQEPRPGEAAG